LGSRSLVDSNFHLNLTMGQSNLSKLQDPTALFEFTLSDSDLASPDSIGVADSTAVSTSAPSGRERVCVEFSHSELYDFFLQLEKVQHQLDNLGGVDST